MRDIIDANMSEKETVYNSKDGMHMLTNYLSKLEGELRNDQRLRDNSIIKEFKVIKRVKNTQLGGGSVTHANAQPFVGQQHFEQKNSENLKSIF